MIVAISAERYKAVCHPLRYVLATYRAIEFAEIRHPKTF